MKIPKHPVDEIAAAFYHGFIAAFLLVGLAFHGAVAWTAFRLYAQLPQMWPLVVTLVLYHGIVAGFLIIGLAFHGYAAWRHWKERFEELCPPPRDFSGD